MTVCGRPAAREVRFDGGAIRYDPDRIVTPDRSLFDPASPGSDAVAVGAGGRQAAWYVQGSFGAGLLRHYRRGGLMAKLSADRYVWTGARRTRSFAEFELLRFMAARDLPVPRPLAAAYWRSGATYRAAIIVERIANVQTLAHMLGVPHHESVAAAIFAMHEAGVWHADLNAYNILLDTQGSVWLIDFDKGKRRNMPPNRRRDNLLRLRRSLIKVAGSPGLEYWNRLDMAYWRLARRDITAPGK